MSSFLSAAGLSVEVNIYIESLLEEAVVTLPSMTFKWQLFDGDCTLFDAMTRTLINRGFAPIAAESVRRCWLRFRTPSDREDDDRCFSANPDETIAALGQRLCKRLRLDRTKIDTRNWTLSFGVSALLVRSDAESEDDKEQGYSSDEFSSSSDRSSRGSDSDGSGLSDEVRRRLISALCCCLHLFRVLYLLPLYSICFFTFNFVFFSCSP
jgi:hypothetical protein